VAARFVAPRYTKNQTNEALQGITELTGLFVDNTADADVDTVLRVIQAAKAEEDERKQRLLNAAD
jgi:hypothetical protein